MATYRGAPAAQRGWRLSQLYSDAKEQYRQAITAPSADDAPEIQSLNRKFRLQKDRLIAWGFDWTDGDASQGDAIDESVERAGLTEVVSSILENIIQMIDEVEKMRARSGAGAAYPLEKAIVWDDSNRHRYEDLTRDITSSIDLLCELSKNKPSQPSRSAMPEEKRQLAAKYSLQSYEEAQSGKSSQVQQSAPMLAQKISQSRIIMPEEAPPPYENVGLPCPARIISQLRTSDASNSSTVPVLIEFARFDKIYRDNNVPLPLNRVESFSKFMASHHATRPSPLLNLLGYFEDKTQPRVGLVFEIPPWATGISGPYLKPSTLYDLVLQASKAQPTATSPNVVPALEERYRLAAEVAASFRTSLEGGFLHRNINSNSVSFLPISKPRRQTITHSLKKPVLGGFDLFSEYDIDTPPENLNENMYRHPEDPRINRGSGNIENYSMRFDVYSIGLVLLEIGLWVPLGDLFKEKYSLNDFSVRLEKIWVPRLSSKCGSTFMSAVRQCITAGNNRKATDSQLKMYFERVMTKLDRCCLLDNDSEGSADEAETPQQVRSPGGEDMPSARRQSSIPRKPLPPTLSTANTEDLSESEPRKRHQTAPSGAYPQAPMEPEFEITGVDMSATTKPPRYTFPFVEIPKDVRDTGRTIAKRLCKIGEKVLDPKETSSIAIHGFGETESTCKPTFCIMCTNTKKFYKAVRKNLDFDKNTFDLIIFKGDVVRSKSSKTFRSNAGSGAKLIDELEAKNPGHHVRPLCGASIGAWKNFEHLPPVSFGGIVLVDGEHFGMTVHHMLEAPDSDSEDGDADDEDEEMAEEVNDLWHAPSGRDHPSRSMAKRQERPFTTAALITNEELDDAYSDVSESDVDSITFSDIEEDADDAMSIDGEAGDTNGIPVGAGKNITITQPALADVDEDFFPVEEDKDDDHLDSHTFGELYASSGLRRLNSKGSRQEIDWALFKLDTNRIQPCNVVAGGRRFYKSGTQEKPKLKAPVCRKPFQPHEDHYPASVYPSDDLGSARVHCFGRTSGLSSGRVGSMMEYVKMAGRSTWSESWVVHGVPSWEQRGSTGTTPSLGVPGDSGAWIIDNSEGKVCGHVLAWSEKKKTAYIAPMDLMLDDIKDTLHARTVTLPGQDFFQLDTATGKSVASASKELALNLRSRGAIAPENATATDPPSATETEAIGQPASTAATAVTPAAMAKVQSVPVLPQNRQPCLTRRIASAVRPSVETS